MDLRCLICGAPMRSFFSKRFHTPGLDTVDYWRCEACGFVMSKTHAEMTPAVWERVNYEQHASYQGTDRDPADPNWLVRLQNQAAVLHDLQQLGLLKRNGRWLDYACGDGKLADLLQTRYDLPLLKYERYLRRKEGYVHDEDLVPGSFDFVITTSVFEHFIRREQFDLVESLVSERGVLGVHTLVCESVPADPTWFYLCPVHCTFHTNRSMAVLFRQWGYTSSVYNVAAQLWIWFKNGPRDVETRVQRANGRPDGPFYVFKEGFVDYWKCSPLRRQRIRPEGGDTLATEGGTPRGGACP